MTEIAAWFDASGYGTLSIVLTVLLLERLINWPVAYHPLTLFRLIATNLGLKVNPRKPRTTAQRKIAGTLAIIALLLPLSMILAMLIYLALFPFIFDAILLLVAIQFRPVLRSYEQIQGAIKQEKKALARQYLDQLVLRDTHLLSPMGIAKAAIESLILRTQSQLICVIFWFILTGGLGALIVRLVYEMQQCWSIKLRRNREFGKPVTLLWRAINFIPASLFLIAFAVAQNISASLKAIMSGKTLRLSGNSNTPLIKHLCGAALGVQLNGPVMYEGQKLRWPRIGGSREVKFGDLQRAKGAIYRTIAILLVAYALASVVVIQL